MPWVPLAAGVTGANGREQAACQAAGATAQAKRRRLLQLLVQLFAAQLVQAHKLTCEQEVNTGGRLSKAAPVSTWARMDSLAERERHALLCIVSPPQAAQQPLHQTRSSRCGREGHPLTEWLGGEGVHRAIRTRGRRHGHVRRWPALLLAMLRPPLPLARAATAGPGLAVVSMLVTYKTGPQVAVARVPGLQTVAILQRAQHQRCLRCCGCAGSQTALLRVAQVPLPMLTAGAPAAQHIVWLPACRLRCRTAQALRRAWGCW